MRVRKQVYELVLDDLVQSPVWEFALDEEDEEGQDEATVRPFECSAALDPADGMFIVRSRFILADGTNLTGYLTPPIEQPDDLGTVQPIIVTVGGQVNFWHGLIEPDSSALESAYALLGNDPSSVFPVTFESDVELVDGPVSGVVPGFLFLESLQNRDVKLVL